MNERIKKLARECFDVANDGNGDEYLGTTVGIEKFAELIVLECIKMIENEAEQYAQPTWAVELINDMHEHFGMEK